MDGIDPVVRLMLLCDEVRTDPGMAHKVNVFGLVSSLLSRQEPPFPLVHPQLCVLLQVSGGRGEGDGRIVVRHADADRVAFTSAGHRLSFGPDPLAVVGIVFRIRDGTFAEAGLYWVEFWY